MARTQHTTTFNRRAAMALIDELWEQKRRTFHSFAAQELPSTIYMPPSAGMLLADFRAHTTAPTYAYPLPSDQNDDYVFPAFLQRSVSFDDETGFDVDQDLTGATSSTERIFVYSLRRTYIPPTPGSGNLYQQRLLPVFKIGDKYFCDYTPKVRATFMLATSGSVAQGTIAQFTSSGGTSLYEGGNNSDDTYWTIKASSGVITAYRKMRALVTYSCEVSAAGYNGTDDLTGYVGLNQSHGTSSSADMYHCPNRCYFIIPNAGSTTYRNVALCAAGVVGFDPGEDIRFEISVDGLTGGGSGAVLPNTLWVTVTPIEEYCW